MMSTHGVPARQVRTMQTTRVGSMIHFSTGQQETRLQVCPERLLMRHISSACLLTLSM